MNIKAVELTALLSSNLSFSYKIEVKTKETQEIKK
jgi:hypothetical protein